MRIWDLPPSVLCDEHLERLDEDIHAVWDALTKPKKKAINPEIARWNGRLLALYLYYRDLLLEMDARKLQHKSTLSYELAKGSAVQEVYIDEPSQQVEMLRKKKCKCGV